MIGTIILLIALAATIYGSYTDVKIREVPNWISYPLIGAMLLLRIIDFAITKCASGLIYSIGTGAVFLGLGLAMFYSGQWGGADWKILTAFGIGFGTLIGFVPKYLAPWPFGVTLIMNLLFIAAAYSILYAFGISLGNKKVYNDTKKSMKKYEMHAILAFFFVGCALILYDLAFVMIVILAPLWLLIRYLKSVEKNCLFKTRKWSEVVEFDIPVKDLKMGKKMLQSSKDPNGFTLEKLAECRKLARKGKLPKKIDVKWGLPMIPAFPVTLLISVFCGDILYWFMTLLI